MTALARVANFRHRLDAEAASGLLKGARIPCVIQSAEAAGFGPLPIGTELLVRAEQLEQARRVLRDAGVVQNGQPESEA